MAIRESTDSWVRAKPMRAMAVILAAGLVFGALVGLGGGYKIEQNRVSSGVARLRTQLASQTHQATPSSTPGVKTPVTKKSGLGTERVGKISAIGADTITVATKRLGTLQVHTSSATKIEQAVKGTENDITAGRSVLITINGREVIVLPSGTLLGRPVMKVAADSFSVAKAVGHGTAKVSLAKVTSVDSTSAAARSDLTDGSMVIIAGHAAGKGNFVAVEVVLLPVGSGFAN